MISAPRSALYILALWGAGLAAAAQFAKMSVFFPQLQAAFPDTGLWLGFLVSLISFVGMMFGLVAGMVVARSGARRLLIQALILGAGMSLFQSTMPGLPLMLLSRVFEGMSHLVIVVAAPTLIAGLALPQHRALAMALWSSFFGVTFAAIVLLGTPIVTAHGIGSLFFAHGLYMAIFAALIWAFIPSDSGQSKGLAGVPSFAQILQQHKTVYRSPRISAAAWGWLFYTLTFVAFMTVLPPFLAPDIRATLVSILPITSIVIALFGGVVLIRKFGGQKVILLGFSLSGLFLLLQLFSPAAAALCITLFAALGLIQAASFAIIPELNTAQSDQALATGAIAQTGNIGNLLGTPILLGLTTAMGFNGLILFGTVAYALGITAHVLAAKQRKAETGYSD